jgi:hypothetical protein
MRLLIIYINYNFKMKNSIISSVLTISILLFTNSCKKDDHNHSDHDSINRAIYELKSGTDTVSFSFNDADGDGGAVPVIIGGTLKTNKNYTGSIKLFTLHDGQYEELTSEILAEGTKHQFFFTSSVAGIVVSYDDKDASNNPIGLSNKVQTGSAGSGVLKVTLKHEPNKSAAGVSGGDMTNAGGETDAEISFPITVN